MQSDPITHNVIATIGPVDADATSYELCCSRCGRRTRVAGIVEVLVGHTTALGRFRNSCCVHAEATVCPIGDDPEWQFVGAFMIDSGIATDFPFGFVLTPADDGTSRGLYFECAIDYRAAVIDRLRKGDTPAGPLTIASANPRSIIKHLRQVGLLPQKSIA